MKYLDAWYAHLSVERPYAAFEDQLTKKDREVSSRSAGVTPVVRCGP